MHRREALQGLGVLLGGTLSAACQQAVSVAPAQRSITVAAYDAEHSAIAARLAELIIPATDTPGAAEARVGDFIDYVVSSWYRPDEKERFVAGLAALEESARAQYGMPFLQLDAAQQTALLTPLAAQATTAPFAAGSFFSQLKELTVVGYYTSEVGATQERRYVPMPGKYDGHFRYADVGRQWAS